MVNDSNLRALKGKQINHIKLNRSVRTADMENQKTEGFG